MVNRAQNLYNRLGISQDASPDEIRRAYRDAARHLHPDKNVAVGETELFLDVQEAFDILSDPEKKSHYDAKLPPLPPEPLQFKAIYSRNALAHETEPQLLYVLVQISPEQEPGFEATEIPLNVCLLIDCSTSMQGMLMDTVKATAVELLKQLRPQDVLSLVTFSDRAEVVVPASLTKNVQDAEHAIQMLHARGGTEMFTGLDAAFTEVCRLRDPKRINHIVMITDGRTYGDEENCLTLARQASDQKVGISSLGIGNSWNDELLDRIAKITGGSTTHITKPQDINNYMTEKFDGLSKRYAESATYKFESPENVQIRYAFRLQPEASPLETTSPINLGSIHREESLHVLMELLIRDIPLEQDVVDLLKGQISVILPLRHDSQYVKRFHISRPTSHEKDVTPPPGQIVQAMSRLTLYRMQEKAQEQLAAGNIEDATRQLQNIATRLLADGDAVLAQTILMEIDNIQEKQRFSASGSKDIKYGTRGLLLPSGKKKDSLR